MNKYGELLKKIKIHPLFWAAIGIGIITGYFWELLALFSIVLIHELGHAIAAQYFGWKIKRILILPFGGICEVDEHGNRDFKEDLIVIAAGPFQHLLIAALIPILVSSSALSIEYGKLISQFNMMILIFNLFPIWPLDGGKLVQLFLSSRNPYLKACRQSLVISCVFLIVLHILILYYSPLNLNIWLVLFYLNFSLWFDWKQRRFVFIRFLLERYYGKNRDLSNLEPIEVNGELYLYDVFEQFKRGCKHLIYVGGQTSNTVKLDENELLHAYFTEKRVSAKLKDLVYED